MLALPSIWTPPKKKMSILPWADASNNSLDPSVKLLNFWECKIVTCNFELVFFLSSWAKRAAEPGIGEAAPIATCLSSFNKLVISFIIISDWNTSVTWIKYLNNNFVK